MLGSSRSRTPRSRNLSSRIDRFIALFFFFMLVYKFVLETWWCSVSYRSFFDVCEEGTPIFDIWIVHVELANRCALSIFVFLTFQFQFDVINFREDPLRFCGKKRETNTRPLFEKPTNLLRLNIDRRFREELLPGLQNSRCIIGAFEVVSSAFRWKAFQYRKWLNWDPEHLQGWTGWESWSRNITNSISLRRSDGCTITLQREIKTGITARMRIETLHVFNNGNYLFEVKYVYILVLYLNVVRRNDPFYMLN